MASDNGENPTPGTDLSGNEGSPKPKPSIMTRITRVQTRTLFRIAMAVVAVCVLIAATWVTIDQVTRIKVPDLRGQAAMDAELALTTLGLVPSTMTSEDCEEQDFADQFCVVDTQSPEPGARIHANEVVTLNLAPMRVQMPSVTGLTLAKAVQALDPLGLRHDLADGTPDSPDQGSWTVKDQSPATGTWTAAGESVLVTLDIPMVTMPTVIGQDVGSSMESLLALGLDAVLEPYSSSIDTSLVFVTASSVDEGASVQYGTKVVLSWKAVMPDVIGIPVPEALAILTSIVGQSVSVDSTQPQPKDADPYAVVSSASVDAGTDLPGGSTVTLTWGLKVPDLVGQTVSDVYSLLKTTDLSFRIDGTQGSNDAITSQDPAAGTVVSPGTKLSLVTKPYQVVFEITGNGSSALVTWISPGTFSISQDTSARLPWSKTFPGSFANYDRGNFSAQMNNGSSITCNMYVNGELIETNTSTGAYAIVSCG